MAAGQSREQRPRRPFRSHRRLRCAEQSDDDLRRLDGANLLGDTWVLSDPNGEKVIPRWTQIIPQTTPPARRFSSASDMIRFTIR